MLIPINWQKRQNIGFISEYDLDTYNVYLEYFQYEDSDFKS